MTMHKVPITVAYGDGIGPEIMQATLKILNAAGARIEPEVIEIGEKLYLKGNTDGIEPSAWESLMRTKIFLKAPITTPQGGGYRSLNVTTRKALGLFSNVRPCNSYAPFVSTKHPRMDVVVIRENEEDLYSGVEHRLSGEYYQCLKVITRTGCEKIIRYAFEYAKRNNRKKVSLFVKDNIMKLTDGIMHKVFDQIALEYPEIQNDHYIVDIGSARLADTPEIFDVIVTLNLYGDIISDIAAQIAGSVGLAGTANIGDQCSMFEAIHGSAPTIAGKNIANPSGLLLGAIMMLVHIRQADVATKIQNAWLKTIEDGIHTHDIFKGSLSKELVGTQEFADAVIARLGQKPSILTPVQYADRQDDLTIKVRPLPEIKTESVGIDVFMRFEGRAEDIGSKLNSINTGGLKLKAISNRGIKVWPKGLFEPKTSDIWVCRFLSETPVTQTDALNLLQKITEAGWQFAKTEMLYSFDGQNGFSAIS